MPDQTESSSRIEDEPVPSYVVIADIVGYSEASQPDQSRWVAHFLKILGSALDETVHGRRNIFPTGDGAIVCTYPTEPAIMEEAAACPLNFARALLRENERGPFQLRISINYSPRDTLLSIADYSPSHTEFMQVGDGINLAERVLQFAEPNEIVYTEQYWKCLDVAGLMKPLSYYAHRSVFVKHMREMKLYSYRPNADEADYVYAPADPKEQHFKRYAYFPPLQTETSNRFRRLGLRDELETLCSYAYDSVAAVNSQSAFISWAEVYDILIRMQSRPGTRSLVLSRADQRFSFWSTEGGRAYLGHLRVLRSKGFDQKQIFIYDPLITREVANQEIVDEFHGLQENCSLLKKIHKAYVGKNILSNYIFGVTVFPDLKCAVAPIPTPRSYHDYVETLSFTDVHKVALNYRDFDFANTSFKAFVLADPDRVDELVVGFDELLAGPLEDL